MSRFYTNAIERGDYILLRGYENGKPFSRKIKYNPTLYIQTPSLSNSSYKTLYGSQCDSITFDSISEAKRWAKQYSDVSNIQLFGFERFLYAYLNEEYPGEIDYDPDVLRIANIDIETSMKNGPPNPETALEEITAIGFRIDGVYHAISCVEYIPHREDIVYHKCRDEKELLEIFITLWSKNGYPDIVTGFNIDFFDIPYLVKRISMLLGEKKAQALSPWKSFSSRTFQIMGRQQTLMSIDGISSLDMMVLYKKFTYTQLESYSLNNVCYVELDEKKLDYSEYENLQNLYEKNPQKFIEYNIRDIELVGKLEEKMKFFDMIFALAYDAKVNYNDTFAQVRMWDVIIHNFLLDQKIVIPFTSESKAKNEAYEGAYVKDPIVGMHEWVVNFDLDSLYPHLIMQYNISPETLINNSIDITIDELLNKKPLPSNPSWCLAPNGQYFTMKKQGFLPRIMEIKYNKRSEFKKKMNDSKKLVEAESDPIKKKEFEKLVARYKNMQMAMKIQLNSAYGAIGNAFFRFFDLRQATAVTLGGQLSIQWVARDVNNFMNKISKTENKDYIIAIDTDSIYVNCGPLVKKWLPNKSTEQIVDILDGFAEEKIRPVIKQSFDDLKDYINAFQQKMSMKRECIAERAIWVGKKRYVMNVWDEEGVRYNEPKLKITGIEAVRSSTPEVCRKAIKETFKLIMKGSESDVQAYIATFRNNFNNLPFEDIAFPRGISGMEEYTLTSKGTPIHVRASLNYNELVKQNNLYRKYPLIRDGDKIKFCYLKMPNKTKQNILAIPAVLPKEFKIEKDIDYDMQFDKAFMSPIKNILEVINWQPEPLNTLEDFFS